MLETGVRVFPKDYPETKAFEVVQMMRYEDNLEKLVRMPKKKRP